MDVMHQRVLTLKGLEITDVADALAQAHAGGPSQDQFNLDMGSIEVAAARGDDEVNRIVVQIGVTPDLYSGLDLLEERARENLAVKGLGRASRAIRYEANARLARLAQLRGRLPTLEAFQNDEEPRSLGVEFTPAGDTLADELLGGKNYDQIYSLWKTPGAITDPFVRQRAVTILASPAGVMFPFRAPDQHLPRLFAMHEPGYPERSSIRTRLADRPDLSHEMAQGAIYWQTHTPIVRDRFGVRHDSREDLQALIRQLLPIVDEATADKLFRFVEINDLTPYENSDFVSGYRPLETIITDKEMPFKYKQAALERWCAIAENEESGRARPRKPHERAIAQMSEIMQILTYSYEDDPDSYSALVRVIEDNLRPGITYVNDLKPGSYIGIAMVADSIGDVELRNRFLRRHGRRPDTQPATVLPEAAPEGAQQNVIVGMTGEDGETRLSLGVQSEYFAAIKSGQKTIEGRLAKTKYSNLRPGNTITITDEGTGEQLVMEVESLHIYAGFGPAFARREDYRTAVPSASSAEEAVGVYEQFYTLDKQAAEGVIFLEIKPASSDRAK